MNKKPGAKKMYGCLPPLFKTKAEVIESNAVDIKTFAIRSEHSNMLWHEVDYLTELCFLFPDFIFCLLALGNILDRSEHVIGLAGRVPFHISLKVGDAHFTVRPDHAT